MADRSKIEWTEATWNPVTGCSKVSAGCRALLCRAASFALVCHGQRPLSKWIQGYSPSGSIGFYPNVGGNQDWCSSTR
jgi:hypothetical protein